MTIELRSPAVRALIEPAHGGRLHQLFVEIDGLERPLLVSPEDPAEYAANPATGGCYPMAPWPNRVRDGTFEWRGQRVVISNGRENALHGLVLDQAWDVVARTGRVVEMTREFGPAWPWEGRAWQRIELGANFLAMKMEVRSGRETFPAGCGWHPWFRRDVGRSAEVRVTVPAAQRYVLQEKLPTGELVEVAGEHLLDGRPLGERRLDDCYTGFEDTGSAVIEWDRLRLEMAFACPVPHLQVFTPPGAVCIEPQTCAPDAFNLPGPTSGAAVVAPGRALALSSRWTWSAR